MHGALRSVLLVSVAVTIFPASVGALAAHKLHYLPVGGNAPGNFSVAHVEVRRGPHGSLAASFAVPATTGGPVIVATLTHAPPRRASAYIFAGSPTAQTTPVNGKWTFRHPVSFYGSQLVPQVLTTALSSSGLCHGLPHGTIPTRRLKVRYVTGDPIAGLSPQQTMAQALDITCHRSGGAQLSGAFGH